MRSEPVFSKYKFILSTFAIVKTDESGSVRAQQSFDRILMLN